MTSQDDIALLRAMRERDEITDDQYTALRRYVLWGTPLPPELRSHPLSARLGSPSPDSHPGPPPRSVPGPAPANRWSHQDRSEPRREPDRYPGRGPGRLPPAGADGWYRDGPHPEPPSRPDHVDRAFEPPVRHESRPPAGTFRAGEISDTRYPVQRPLDRQPPDRRPPGRQLPDRRSDQPFDPAPRSAVPGKELELRAPSVPAERTPTQIRLQEPTSRPARPAITSARRRPPPAPGRRRRQFTVLVSAVLVLALVGAGVWWFALRVSPVQPDVYAQRVCTTVGQWQGQMASAREQLVATIDGKDPPQKMRDRMVAFYQDAEERTARLSVSLAKIGPPNVVGGARYAESLRQAVATTALSFHGDAEQAEALDTSTKAIFAKQAQAQVASIDSRSQPMFGALSGRGLEPPLDVRTAFDSDPSCAAYTG